jgi:hypothetical protein
MKLNSKSTRNDAEKWYFQLIQHIGTGFHPDTDATDYINLQTGKQLFGKKQADEINNNLDIVFKIIPDPYKLGLPIVQDLFAKRLRPPVIQ